MIRVVAAALGALPAAVAPQCPAAVALLWPHVV